MFSFYFPATTSTIKLVTPNFFHDFFFRPCSCSPDQRSGCSNHRKSGICVPELNSIFPYKMFFLPFLSDSLYLTSLFFVLLQFNNFSLKIHRNLLKFGIDMIYFFYGLIMKFIPSNVCKFVDWNICLVTHFQTFIADSTISDSESFSIHAFNWKNLNMNIQNQE